MKLFRFGEPGQEKPGVLGSEGLRWDVSAFGEDWNEEFFASDGLARLETWLAEHGPRCPVLPEDVRLGPCVARPSKIICIGLNFAGHVKETGAEMPGEPVVFFKATTALCGPYDDIVIPPGSEKTDWEVELAVVMEKRATYVSEDEAMDYVAGYAVHNDYSERAWQLERGGQWVKGKSFDTYAPIGPFLVPAGAVPDPHDLGLWLEVNGERLQESNTSDLIFRVPALVSYLSRFMTLLPGDIISTGTPSGVGLGLDPPRYLKPGDVVELGIDGLGSSRQEAVAFEDLEETLSGSGIR
ncbi:MAG: fumarylacetoacetate hydrolase family protein [Gemmatimonadetes bacterium]|nr:fumarylacetoacetate hydrolase family protein [Gemmatimonadota bacterium]NNM04644.1 fumarylacetoacetate hydrolase family protein [Gemmatimonadota bacterium]